MSTAFRNEVKKWLAEHCPPSLIGTAPAFSGGRRETIDNPDVRVWFDRCLERGWTVPSWPQQYGGAGLEPAEQRILAQERAALGAPVPLVGMGVSMIGPTLLEYGSDAQKAEHLTRIANGEVRWCQGYSEPGAGSDLAALSTRAEDNGDEYLINGSKIWTSGAQLADWMFCLVRTDPNAKKHEGISFVLFPMDDPGVSVKPIVLINGESPFCQCFFDNVRALKSNLVGQENRGWTIGKRLLQHERSSISGPGSVTGGRGSLNRLARQYVGDDASGRIADDAVRDTVTRIEMDARAFTLTQTRVREESTSDGTPTFATSIFKYYATELAAARQEAIVGMMGTQGVGWDGPEFTDDELGATRFWLFGKALTIAGGSSEVQLNIIAKRVLGLPD